jgi:DNA polymerase III sliding clamp (beta) subunit (PCNA family)
MKQMKIATEKFQDMVARASKGASENKLLPITRLMAFELKDNVLTLTTTDTATA